MSQAIVQALEDQVVCYRRLAKLAELQHQHVQQGQTELLLDVLKSRQAVLNEITRLESTVSPAKRDWQLFASKIDSTVRTRAESLLTEAREILSQITLSDQNDALVLQQQKLNVGRQLNQTTVARKVNRRYATAAYGSRQSRMDLQQ
ncbi:MAG TPA: hypothetical protein VHD56_11470 [Tepidisphaeraceae bacterium]|nr:hypothetical protein [Tepidisphaeraceae bacterium]